MFISQGRERQAFPFNRHAHTLPLSETRLFDIDDFHVGEVRATNGVTAVGKKKWKIGLEIDKYIFFRLILENGYVDADAER